MRALILASCVLFAAPAMAQEIYCEGVVETSAGEVIAAYRFRPNETAKTPSVSWMPPRDKYESFDAKFMTSPRLMLHFRMDDSGKLAGPSDLNIVTTGYSIPRTGEASPLTKVQVEAVASPSNSKLSWKASEARKGEPELAKLVRDEKPAKITIKLLESGKVTANAEFDLKEWTAIGEMAVRAKAKADGNVAKYKQLVADGKKPRECPY